MILGTDPSRRIDSVVWGDDRFSKNKIARSATRSLIHGFVSMIVEIGSETCTRVLVFARLSYLGRVRRWGSLVESPCLNVVSGFFLAGGRVRGGTENSLAL